MPACGGVKVGAPSVWIDAVCPHSCCCRALLLGRWPSAHKKPFGVWGLYLTTLTFQHHHNTPKTPQPHPPAPHCGLALGRAVQWCAAASRVCAHAAALTASPSTCFISCRQAVLGEAEGWGREEAGSRVWVRGRLGERVGGGSKGNAEWIGGERGGKVAAGVC